MSKWKLSKEQLEALSECKWDSLEFTDSHRIVHNCLVGMNFEEIQEPLKKGDKIRYGDWFGYYQTSHSSELLSIVSLDGLVLVERWDNVEPYEWTDDDLRKQFEEATK